jgi:hypothetical protein
MRLGSIFIILVTAAVEPVNRNRLSRALYHNGHHTTCQSIRNCIVGEKAAPFLSVYCLMEHR